MMTRRAILGAFGPLLVPGLSCYASRQESVPAIRAGEHRLPIKVRDGLIYVQADVNGSRATLLVDTGAVLTTFTLRLVPRPNTDSRITVNLAKGSVAAFRLPVGFILGEPGLKGRQCSFRQDALVGDFKFMDADGVVGLDVLSLFKSATFDFKNSVLILEDR
jgi:hypothetical protein